MDLSQKTPLKHTKKYLNKEISIIFGLFFISKTILTNKKLI